jgi:lipooligosaccharide transport system ATP-binding protein
MSGRKAGVDSAIQARALTKRFGELTAVDAIEFEIDVGQAFGFLGANRAGKTSTMQMIACLSAISGGTL